MKRGRCHDVEYVFMSYDGIRGMFSFYHTHVHMGCYVMPFSVVLDDVLKGRVLHAGGGGADCVVKTRKQTINC